MVAAAFHVNGRLRDPSDDHRDAGRCQCLLQHVRHQRRRRTRMKLKALLPPEMGVRELNNGVVPTPAERKCAPRSWGSFAQRGRVEGDFRQECREEGFGLIRCGPADNFHARLLVTLRGSSNSATKIGEDLYASEDDRLACLLFPMPLLLRRGTLCRGRPATGPWMLRTLTPAMAGGCRRCWRCWDVLSRRRRSPRTNWRRWVRRWSRRSCARRQADGRKCFRERIAAWPRIRTDRPCRRAAGDTGGARRLAQNPAGADRPGARMPVPPSRQWSTLSM